MDIKKAGHTQEDIALELRQAFLELGILGVVAGTAAGPGNFVKVDNSVEVDNSAGVDSSTGVDSFVRVDNLLAFTIQDSRA
jgi:hypothetical protein